MSNRRTFAIISHPNAGKTSRTGKLLLTVLGICAVGLSQPSEADERVDTYVAADICELVAQPERFVGQLVGFTGQVTTWAHHGTSIAGANCSDQGLMLLPSDDISSQAIIEGLFDRFFSADRRPQGWNAVATGRLGENEVWGFVLEIHTLEPLAE